MPNDNTSKQDFDVWCKLNGFFPGDPCYEEIRQTWDTATYTASQRGCTDKLSDLNDSTTANMTDAEYLRHVDVCDDPVVVELARRLAMLAE